jgi:uncharacterized membrane protein YgdD (TMEM256/DUF423 family)
MNVLLFFVGINGAFSVLFGAWLSHSDFVLATKAMEAVDKALQYQFIHTLALYITVLYMKASITSDVTINKIPSSASVLNKKFFSSAKLLTTASIFFALGILLFSGGIYLKNIFEISTFAQFIPLGGMFFALAWCLIATSAIKLANTE